MSQSAWFSGAQQRLRFDTSTAGQYICCVCLVLSCHAGRINRKMASAMDSNYYKSPAINPAWPRHLHVRCKSLDTAFIWSVNRLLLQTIDADDWRSFSSSAGNRTWNKNKNERVKAMIGFNVIFVVVYFTLRKFGRISPCRFLRFTLQPWQVWAWYVTKT